MGYIDLEERLQQLNLLQKAQRTFEQISSYQDFVLAFKYALSIANDLERHGIQDYAFIGGFAVLFHLINERGEQVVAGWRGSTDVDLSTRSYNLEAILRGYYQSLRKQKSHLTKNKVDFHITDATLQTPCVIDAYFTPRGETATLNMYTIDEQFWKNIDQLKVFGLTIPAASKIELVKMKLSVALPKTRLPRDQDVTDIFLLCGLLEPQRSAEEVIMDLHMPARSSLLRILAQTDYQYIKKLRHLSVTPSEVFIEALKRHLPKAPP